MKTTNIHDTFETFQVQIGGWIDTYELRPVASYKIAQFMIRAINADAGYNKATLAGVTDYAVRVHIRRERA